MMTHRSSWRGSTVLLLLGHLTLSLQHSLLTCTDYRPPDGNLMGPQGDDYCYGRPRGWQTALLDTQHLDCAVYRPGNGGHAAGEKPQNGSDCYKNFTSQGVGGYTCDQGNQRRTTPFSAGYDNTTTYAVYKPGRVVCVEWPGMNHVLGENVLGTLTTYSTGNARISGIKARESHDPTQEIITKYAFHWDLPYDNCAASPKSKLDRYLNKQELQEGRARPCRGCFTIPANWTDGLYMFQWLWELNTDEWYSTCWDAVISSASPDYNLTAPNFQGYARNISATAGIQSTVEWRAPPLGQDTGNLNCPAGLGGPLCTPVGIPSPFAPPAQAPGSAPPPAPIAPATPTETPAALPPDGGFDNSPPDSGPTVGKRRKK